MAGDRVPAPRDLQADTIAPGRHDVDAAVVFWRRLKGRADGRRKGAAMGSPPWPGSGLEVCAACHAPFVHVLDRMPAGEGRWRLALRCGACEARREVVVTEDVARRFDGDIVRGLEQIAQELRELIDAADLHA